MLRRILFVAISVGMVLISLDLMADLGQYHDRIPTAVQGLLGVVLTLTITGSVAFPGFVFPLWSLLPDSYYHAGHPDRTAILGRVLGIGVFRMLLMAFFWGHARNRGRFFDGTRWGLERLDVETRRAEFGHLLAGVLCLMACAWLAFHGLRVAAYGALACNILMNAYPIVLQRMHRARLTPLLGRLSRDAGPAEVPPATEDRRI